MIVVGVVEADVEEVDIKRGSFVGLNASGP